VYERTIFISLLLCKRVTIIVRLLHTFVNPEIDTLAVVTKHRRAWSSMCECVKQWTG